MEEPSKCQSWQRDLFLVEVLSPALRGVGNCRSGLQAPGTWALAALSIEFAVFRPSQPPALPVAFSKSSHFI